MKKIPTKLSAEEIKQRLFDGLMEQIEPKLTIAERKSTAAELAAMTPEVRAEWMHYYQRAYEEFLDRWPGYVAAAMKSLEGMSNEVVASIGKKDQEHMQSIENAFDISSQA